MQSISGRWSSTLCIEVMLRGSLQRQQIKILRDSSDSKFYNNFNKIRVRSFILNGAQ